MKENLLAHLNPETNAQTDVELMAEIHDAAVERFSRKTPGELNQLALQRFGEEMRHILSIEEQFQILFIETVSSDLKKDISFMIDHPITPFLIDEMPINTFKDSDNIKEIAERCIQTRSEEVKAFFQERDQSDTAAAEAAGFMES